MSIKHLAAIVLEYKCDIPNNIVKTIATSLGYTLTEAIIICKPRQKLYEKSCMSSIRDSDKVDDTVQCIFYLAVARHYSDSCPVVIDGEERFAIVMKEGICRYCLENCPAERCRFRTKRPCWYCKKIEGTIVEDLIPDDRGHTERYVLYQTREPSYASD
ncbi:unnamed protein product [Heligmosomoides polygyrus]|uniref:DUF5651 domain-containing protein n=1 Tax=Heligmosomoides polygyrus TaxID=6339 RepID=A0A183GX65_HELPZ|nr:unnamed protein product [Heligmosomoides polygyrus]